MATPKRLDFSSSGSGDSDTPLQKKPPSTHAAEEQDPMTKTKKTKKKKKKKSLMKQIWNEDNELAVLKGLVDYRVKTRDEPSFDWDGFFGFIKGSIEANVTKKQLMSKLRKLKRSFVVHLERITQGKDPLFTRCTDSLAFGYAKMIWDSNDGEVDNRSIVEKANQDENGESAFKENEQVGIDEPVNENGKLLPEVVCMEKAQQTENGGSAFKENGEDGIDEPVNENGTPLPEVVGMENEENASKENGQVDNEPVNENVKSLSEVVAMVIAQTENGESAFKENEQVAYDEPVHELGKSLTEGVGMEKAQQTESNEYAFKEDGQVANDKHVKENGKLLPEAQQIENGECALKEKGQASNDEPVNENGADKSKSDGKILHEAVGVDKTTEHKADGKENHVDDDDADDYCTVQDAFETVVLQGLSSYQKKLQVEKLMMNIGSRKRKALSIEWKALCAEEVRLNIKRIRFSAKLAEAVNGELK